MLCRLSKIIPAVPLKPGSRPDTSARNFARRSCRIAADNWASRASRSVGAEEVAGCEAEAGALDGAALLAVGPDGRGLAVELLTDDVAADGRAAVEVMVPVGGPDALVLGEDVQPVSRMAGISTARTTVRTLRTGRPVPCSVTQTRDVRQGGERPSTAWSSAVRIGPTRPDAERG